MGNTPSKDPRGSPLTRTDTAGSAKSSRSLRSRRSFKEESPVQSSPPQEKLSVSSVGTPNILTNTALSRSSSSTNLPPSMMQIEPKDPILIRRNTNDTISNGTGLSLNNSGASFSLNNSAASFSQSVDSQTVSLSPANALKSSIPSYPLSPQLTRKDAEEDAEEDAEVKEIPLLKQLLGASQRSQRGSSPGTPIGTPGGTPSITPGGTPGPSSVNLGDSTTLDIEDLIQRLLDAGYSGKRTKNVCLKNSEIQLVCSTAREVLLSQPSLLELSPPVKVVGDVHGQYGDLIRIFTKCGFPPLTNYLFLGDYVDRGKQSLETILLLLCYKIKYPENFFLLRGNHECANVTRVYGFYDECKRRCNIKTWKMFIDTFNTLPIAAIVAGKIFCVHGGLSPVLNSMDEIRNIARPTDVPDFGLLNDLLWSDPADTVNEWEDNERGVLYVFSKVAINKFLLKFGFDLVCRAHMVVEDGYEFFNDRTLVTVFSAPNYCGEFDNWGAVMSVSEELLCLFELLDPLDSVALKLVMKKGRQERKSAQLQKQRWG